MYPGVGGQSWAAAWAPQTYCGRPKTIQFQTFETTSKIIDKPESNYQRPSAAKHYQLEFLRFRVESKMGKSIFDLRVVTKISWVFSGGV